MFENIPFWGRATIAIVGIIGISFGVAFDNWLLSAASGFLIGGLV